MKSTIGERITYWNDEGQFYLEISGKIEKWKETLLFVWGIAWSFCGIYIIMFFFGEGPKDEKVFLTVYLAFWAYFEYKVINIWLWRKFGKERIRVTQDALEIKNDVLGYGVVKRYFKDNIKDFGIIQYKASSFNTVYGKSFWVIGGEGVGFDHLGSKVAFGRQIEEKESLQVEKLLKKHLKKKS